MRVAYVCTDPGVPVFGNKGCSIHVQEMLRVFLGNNWDIDLYARRIGGTAPDDLTSVQCIALPPPDKGLDRADREHQLMALDRKLRITLENSANYDLVYERHALWSSAAMEFATDSNIPSVLEVNSPLIEEEQKHRSIHAIQRAQEIAARSFNAADLLLAVSNGVADYLGQFPSADSRTFVCPNGVDWRRLASANETIQNRWQLRAEGKFEAPIVIGFVGTLRPWHGLEILGRGFRRFHEMRPASRLLVIGDGPAKEDLNRALGKAAAQATTITGKVSHAEVASLLSQIDIATAPYPHLERFYFSPLKIFEYMAAGLPVVASAIGDIPGIIDHDVNGLLTPAGDEKELVRRWERLANQPSLALRLGDAAAKKARSCYSWQNVFDAVIRRIATTAVLNDLPGNEYWMDRVQIGEARSAG